jgi:hypothetical protein
MFNRPRRVGLVLVARELDSDHGMDDVGYRALLASANCPRWLI